MSTLATYYRSGGTPKTYRCEPGEAAGTVNLLDKDGEVIVRGCQVIEDPETAVKLPDGYCTLDGEAPAKKAGKKKPKDSADED